ncbi:MAG: DNA-processing protein DprA [Pseudomonadota bacterium]
MDVADAIALYLLLEQQPGAYRHALEHLQSPTVAMAASVRQWRSVGMSAAACDRRAAWPQGRSVEAIREQWLKSLRWLESEHRGIWFDSTGNDAAAQVWPRAFAGLPKRPPLLFWEGDDSTLGLPQIAIVGSRAATRAGLAQAESLAAELARAGLTVTSGLASGIDGAAHAGALSVDGRTLAVLGCGLDRIYPPRHQGLAQRIVENGLLVSEFAPGSTPEPWCFPRRNKVIAALSLGVLVVEAGPASGSIITAQAAEQLSRLVWAMPGSVSSLQSRGCHGLIRTGQAKLAETAQDVIEDALPTLRDWYGESSTALPAESALESPRADPGENGRHLLEVMGWQVAAVDNLLAQAGLAADQVLMTLSELEITGWIGSVPGGYQRLAS